MNAFRSALLADARIVDALYWLCFFALPVAAVLVLLRGRRNNGPDGTAVNRFFAGTALSLLGWLATLYALYRYREFGLSNDPGSVLLLGRANFASAICAVYFALRFVLSLAETVGIPEGFLAPVPFRSRRLRSLLAWESLGMALLTLFTPLVDRAETIFGGTAVPLSRPATEYGSLFPLYAIHVLAYLATAVWLALIARREAVRPARDQLGLVAFGTLMTGSIALVTNAVIPYFFGDFRFTDVGTLSVIWFLLAISFAIARHRLFDLKLFVRRTVVYGILLSAVLAVYSAVVLLVTQKLTEKSAGTLTQFSVLVLASAFDPLRRFLEDQVDKLIFPDRDRRAKGRSRS